ncbi:hypothetical protein DsansV1_C26g0191401 [Dioscorea sansibarensis]
MRIVFWWWLKRKERGGNMTMVSTCCAASLFTSSPSTLRSHKLTHNTKRTSLLTPPLCHQNPISPSPSHLHLLHKSIPLAASASILLLCSSPVILILVFVISWPMLASSLASLAWNPFLVLSCLNLTSLQNLMENQKKYAEFDERFKSSPVLKELLEKSKLNKQRNKREIQDKYCIRGAEWGVGDCSTQGMTQEERDEFIAMLKKKSGGD